MKTLGLTLLLSGPTLTSKDVLPSRYRLQVSGIYIGSVPTEVVKSQTFGDRSDP